MFRFMLFLKPRVSQSPLLALFGLRTTYGEKKRVVNTKQAIDEDLK